MQLSFSIVLAAFTTLACLLPSTEAGKHHKKSSKNHGSSSSSSDKYMKLKGHLIQVTRQEVVKDYADKLCNAYAGGKLLNLTKKNKDDVYNAFDAIGLDRVLIGKDFEAVKGAKSSFNLMARAEDGNIIIIPLQKDDYNLHPAFCYVNEKSKKKMEKKMDKELHMKESRRVTMKEYYRSVKKVGEKCDRLVASNEKALQSAANGLSKKSLRKAEEQAKSAQKHTVELAKLMADFAKKMKSFEKKQQSLIRKVGKVVAKTEDQEFQLYFDELMEKHLNKIIRKYKLSKKFKASAVDFGLGHLGGVQEEDDDQAAYSQ